jgi:hypothetical protein
MEVPSRLVRIAGFVAPAYRAAPNNAFLLCLCDNTAITPYAAPMLRSPEPPTGFVIDDRFAVHYADALKINPEIHDGAIMARRIGERHYIVSGWSYRLFPPPVAMIPTANRGSAFHSCLAMSALPGIDGLLLFSGEEVTMFQGGEVLKEPTSLLGSDY